MWCVCGVLYVVLYVRVTCFLVVDVLSREGIYMFAIVFSVVSMYLDHLKFCVVCINGLYVVVYAMLSLMSVMSKLSVRTVVKLCTLVVLL